jgi:uncharacterized membrane protein HdeD (DUF308 family)
MLRLVANNWWAYVLRGVIIAFLAIVALLSPGITAITLLFWVALFFFFEGIVILLGTIMSWKEREDKWMSVLEGALTVILGIIVYRAPELALYYAVLYVGIWAIMSGSSRIAMAIQLRKEIKGEFWLALNGAIAVLFGVLIIAYPGIGLATLMWMLGCFGLVAGLILVVFGFKVKKLAAAAA